MPNILLVPDVFFHRWERSDGELWICLRSFILAPGVSAAKPFGNLSEFDAWAADPHALATTFTYSLTPPAAAGCVARLAPDTRAIPVNLPSNVDVWMRIVRGAADPATWVRVARARGCKTSLAMLPGEVADAIVSPDPSKQASFSWWFNEAVRLRHASLAGQERDEMSAWLELRMESGQPIAWEHETKIRDLFRNEADPAKPVLPLFRPAHAWGTAFGAGTALESNLFWLNGQMLALGRKPVAADIATITGVDIVLMNNSVPLDDGAPDLTRALYTFQIPKPQPGVPGPSYFSLVQDRYDGDIDCTLEDAAVLLPGTLSVGADPAAPVAYFSPALRAYTSMGKVLAGGWEHVASSGKESGQGGPDAVGRFPLLKNLAGVQVRAPASAATAALNVLAITPGVVVRGRLQPYRRFPALTGTGDLLATVMVFEPDAGGAGLLELIEKKLGAAALGALFSSAKFDDGWTLKLLDTAPLPWDGPHKVFRVLARPKDKAASTGADGLLTCPARPALLHLNAPRKLATTPRADQDIKKSGVMWLWKPDGVNSVDTLAQDWLAKVGAWAEMPVTSLMIDMPGVADAAVDTLVIGDYTFALANSRLRIEQYLGVQSPLSGGADACMVNQSPLQDYEDDLVNYNTARVRRADGPLLDQRVRYAQSGAGMVRDLNRHQVIPLLFEWNREPNDLKEHKPDATGTRQVPPVSWDQMQRYVRFAALEASTMEPLTIELEHTYATSLPARTAQDVPIQLRRSGAFDWPVAFPTVAECSNFGIGAMPAAAAPRFLVCRYDAAGTMVLTFDPRVLDPDQLPMLARRDAETLAMTAWRAVAELAAAAQIFLQIEHGLFDLGTRVGRDAVAAAAHARTGFSGRWIDAVTFSVRDVALGSSGLDALKKWVSGLLRSSTPAFAPLTLTIAIDTGDWKLSASAHVAIARLALVREEKHQPAAAMRLAPMTQQSGLGEVAPDSLWAAWAQLGFGPGADVNQLADDVKRDIKNAFCRWRASYADGADSVTPEVVPAKVLPAVSPVAPAPAPAPVPPLAQCVAAPLCAVPETEKRDAEQGNHGLISELHGTDWFAPQGSPDESGIDIEAQLLPFGFAPCARHPELGAMAQQVLQRVLASLRDTVDLVYEKWARTPDFDWVKRLEDIAALASYANGTWSGPVPQLVARLVERLLAAQPDGASPDVDTQVSEMINAYDRPVTPIAQLRLAAERMMLEDLALFADAKALLLTRAAFVPSTCATRSPPPGSLARASFSRIVRPEAADKETANVDAVLGWNRLVAAGSGPGPLAQMGYLEVLDDARYDNAFAICRTLQKFETFENMVDRDSTQASWTMRAPRVPARAENAQADHLPRELRLASRAIVTAPELLWSGPSSALGTALAAAKPSDTGWTADDLASGAKASGAGNLVVAATRRVPAQWDHPLTVDRQLVHFVYRVSGDEESTLGLAIDAFDNDGFFIRGVRTENRTTPSGDAPVTVLAAGAEQALRRFLDVNRGSAEAADVSEKFLLNNLPLYQDVMGLIRTESAPALQDDAVLLRALKVGTSAGEFCLGAKTAGQDMLERVRHVVLFVPARGTGEGAKVSSAYLVLSLALDAWSGWDVTLTQSRNMPLDQWGAACSAVNGRRPAPFARVFWQATDQSSMPVTQHVAASAVNTAAHWDTGPGKHRVFTLPQAWIGRELTAKEVVERILFTEQLWVGDAHRATTILSASSETLALETPFSMTVFQEQFVTRSGPPQVVRHPFPSFLRLAAGDEHKKRVWFPEEFATFSIDIRWMRPRGSAFLEIERVFARAL